MCFKKIAYNWLSAFEELPPCYDASGALVEPSEIESLCFPDEESRRIAFAFMNGKIAFAYWCIIGDDFHVKRWMLGDFPHDLSGIDAESRGRLLELAIQLENCMKNNVVFKLNAGKRVGSYNLAACRSITDQSDAILAESLGIADVLGDIDLLYGQIVKTDFE